MSIESTELFGGVFAAMSQEGCALTPQMQEVAASCGYAAVAVESAAPALPINYESVTQ